MSRRALRWIAYGLAALAAAGAGLALATVAATGRGDPTVSIGSNLSGQPLTVLPGGAVQVASGAATVVSLPAGAAGTAEYGLACRRPPAGGTCSSITLSFSPAVASVSADVGFLPPPKHSATITMCRGAAASGAGCVRASFDGSTSAAQPLSLKDAIGQVTMSENLGRAATMYIANLSYQQVSSGPSDSAITSTTATTGSGGGSPLWPWIVGGGALVAGGIALAFHVSKTPGERAEWELEAENGDPPEHCRPCQHYTQWKATLAPSRRHVEAVELAASDPAGAAADRASSASHDTTERLDAALRAYAHAGDRGTADAEEELGAVARAIVAEIADWLAAEPSPLDVVVSARLVGGKASADFTRYQCVRKPGTGDDDEGRWDKDDRWKGSLTSERVLPPASLPGFRARAAGIAAAEAALAGHLRRWAEALRPAGA